MNPGDDVRLAVGGVREGLAAVQSLVGLLRSRRVSSHGLGGAVAAAREGIAELEHALEELERAALKPLASDVALTGASSAFFAERRTAAAALTIELAGIRRGAIDARRRLALERTASSVSPMIDDAICLVDLLEAIAAPRPTPLDLIDLLRDRWAATKNPARVVVELDPRSRAPLSVDARLAGGLLELVVSAIAPEGGGVHLTVETDSTTAALVRLAAREAARDSSSKGATRAAADGTARLEAPRRKLPIELIVGIAHRAGFALALEVGAPDATLRLGSS